MTQLHGPGWGHRLVRWRQRAAVHMAVALSHAAEIHRHRGHEGPGAGTYA